eukprot:TRINITY_DN15812_c0_g1_i2.p1 TRINITY_DN15812_c0_g1~~TRINITY_DN15812_c0_g1_i2.p1  ORF type:complete len:121 (+),score=19.92 TRINITY_DN15812_c0_g1_i2:28-390(+)
MCIRDRKYARSMDPLLYLKLQRMSKLNQTFAVAVTHNSEATSDFTSSTAAQTCIAKARASGVIASQCCSNSSCGASSIGSRSTTPMASPGTCLLYTSDAADEEDSVDLGGRRIIQKKKNI